MSKNLRGKYSQNLDRVKKSATEVPKTTSMKVIQEVTEITGDLVGTKIANKTAKNSPQNISDTNS